MILLAGIPRETPLAWVARELERLGVPFVCFDQRRAASSACAYRLDVQGLHGTLTLGERQVRLEDVSAVYTRVMDDRFLPELKGQPVTAPARVASRRLHDTLFTWMELSPARVVNTAASMASNASKPFQAQLVLQAGFSTPETLITNEPDLVRDFAAEHGRVVYKSISGTRSIVQELGPGDLERLDDIRWCPVQFQALVEGVDVRVHVVGRQVHATRVASAAIDYRYAGSQVGAPARLEATRLSEAVEERCIALTARLGLRFSGIDLRITPDGEVFCFEVNPCPAYSYYQGHTGQPIARALARHLVGLDVV